MFKIIGFVIFISIFNGLLAKQADILEWKDYTNGIVPENPIPIGYNLEYQHIYIGLVHVVNGSNEGYIPTNVYEGIPYVNVTLDDETVFQVTEGIKVLCGTGDYLNKLVWYGVRSVNFMYLFDSDEMRPVRAGWQVGEFNGIPYNSSLYIGKALSGHIYTGKIYTSNSDISKNNVLITPYEYQASMPVAQFVDYDALVFYN